MLFILLMLIHIPKFLFRAVGSNVSSVERSCSKKRSRRSLNAETWKA